MSFWWPMSVGIFNRFVINFFPFVYFSISKRNKVHGKFAK